MGVGSEMLWVGGQMVLVLGIWGKARRDWGVGGVGGENVSKEGEGR